MNTYKNIFRACNGTRIAQCSLLIALAFLCLAIVCLCVFYNLNALATDNIAFAEVIELENINNNRSVVSGITFSNNNLYSSEYALLNKGNSLTISSVVGSSGWYSDNASDITVSVSSSYTTFSNSTTSTRNVVCLLQVSPYNANTYTFSTGIVNKSGNIYYANYNYSSNGMFGFTTSGQSMNGTTPFIFYSAIAKQVYQSTIGFGFSLTANSSISIEWIKVEEGGSFTGQPSDSYLPNGYDVGFAEGQQTALVPEPDYSDISSTGIVRENLLDNNDWINASYNISVTDSTNIFFDGVNFDNELVCDGTASIIGNTYSNDRLSYIRFNVKSFSTPIITASKYTFTICVANVNSRSSTYVGAFVGNWGDQEEILEGSDADGFYSYTFDFTSLSNYDFNDFYLELESRAGASFDILWFKFEEGESFSGYVPKSYKMYGYNDGVSAGRDIGYQEGYNDGYDNAKLESFNRIGTLFEVDNYSSVSEYYPLGTDKVLVSYVAETDSFTFNGTTYRFSYFDTQGDDSLVDGRGVYNGYVLEYSFQYKIRVNTLFYGAWNRLGFKLLVIREDNHNDYFYVTREDTSYITYLSTWTGTDFGDVQQVQIDIPLQGSYYYQLAFVPINWNYHDINAQSRELRAESYQDTSTFLIWDNTEIFGLTDNSAYQNIVEQRIEDSWSEGHYDGLQEGKSIGYTNGYNVGYNAGVNAAGDYTFYSLLGAVFDTPISTLRGLLNFNILGVNLYDFVIALLSLAIVLFVFRIFVRGL